MREPERSYEGVSRAVEPLWASRSPVPKADPRTQ